MVNAELGLYRRVRLAAIAGTDLTVSLDVLADSFSAKTPAPTVIAPTRGAPPDPVARLVASPTVRGAAALITELYASGLKAGLESLSHGS